MQNLRTKSYTSCLRVGVVSVLLKQYLAFLSDLLISLTNRYCLLPQVLIINREKSHRTIQAVINTSTGLYLKEQVVCPKLTLKYRVTSQRQNRKTCCAWLHLNIITSSELALCTICKGNTAWHVKSWRVKLQVRNRNPTIFRLIRTKCLITNENVVLCREEVEDENLLSDELIKDKLPPQKDNESEIWSVSESEGSEQIIERSLCMKIRAKFYVL